MLGWIAIFAVSCAGSGLLGLGYLMPLAGSLQSVCLTLTAVLAMLLVSAWDAFETQSVSSSQDDGS